MGIHETKKNKPIPPIPIDSAIIDIRGERVILDSELAAIYGVPTGQLNEQVNLNIERFPDDI